MTTHAESACRTCWLGELPASERDRVAAEPIMSSVYLCAEHQADWDRMVADMPPIEHIHHDDPLPEFPPAPKEKR